MSTDTFLKKQQFYIKCNIRENATNIGNFHAIAWLDTVYILCKLLMTHDTAHEDATAQFAILKSS